jgi:hypothetical protein
MNAQHTQSSKYSTGCVHGRSNNSGRRLLRLAAAKEATKATQTRAFSVVVVAASCSASTRRYRLLLLFLLLNTGQAASNSHVPVAGSASNRREQVSKSKAVLAAAYFRLALAGLCTPSANEPAARLRPANTQHGNRISAVQAMQKKTRQTCAFGLRFRLVVVLQRRRQSRNDLQRQQH